MAAPVQKKIHGFRSPFLEHNGLKPDGPDFFEQSIGRPMVGQAKVVAYAPDRKSFDNFLLVDDEGNAFDARELPDHGDRLSRDLIAKRKKKLREQDWASTMRDGISRIGRHEVDNTWDGFHGSLALKQNAAAAQGKNFKVKGLGDMPTTQRAQAQRPSMAALSGRSPNDIGAGIGDDGWVHPDIRIQQNELRQQTVNRGRQAEIDAMRQREPMSVAYDKQQEDARTVASTERVDAGVAPVQARQRQRARDEGVADTRAAALEQSINPFFIEQRGREDKNLMDRASMEAFARIMGSIRPETAEEVSRNPGTIDTIRRGVLGQPQPVAPQPTPADGPVDGFNREQPAAVEPPMAVVQSTAEIPPAARVQIEQRLREFGYAVNDQTILAGYNALAGR